MLRCTEEMGSPSLRDRRRRLEEVQFPSEIDEACGVERLKLGTAPRAAEQPPSEQGQRGREDCESSGCRKGCEHARRRHPLESPKVMVADVHRVDGVLHEQSHGQEAGEGCTPSDAGPVEITGALRESRVAPSNLAVGEPGPSVPEPSRQGSEGTDAVGSQACGQKRAREEHEGQTDALQPERDVAEGIDPQDEPHHQREDGGPSECRPATSAPVSLDEPDRSGIGRVVLVGQVERTSPGMPPTHPVAPEGAEALVAAQLGPVHDCPSSTAQCVMWPQGLLVLRAVGAAVRSSDAPPNEETRAWGARVGLRCGRGDRIRTCDPLTPSQVRYQTALLPEIRRDRLASFGRLLEPLRPRKGQPTSGSDLRLDVVPELPDPISQRLNTIQRRPDPLRIGSCRCSLAGEYLPSASDRVALIVKEVLHPEEA